VPAVRERRDGRAAGRLLLGAVTCTVLVLSGSLATSASSAAEPSGRFDRPLDGFSPAGTTLQRGTPADAGLDGATIEEALAAVAAWTEASDAVPPQRPLQAGAVTVMGTDGVVVAREAAGWALRYADGEGTELPREQWVPATADTVWDLASVSKLFTSVVVMQQVEAGRVGLDDPVAQHVDEFAAGGKDDVTVRQLLTHTGGLPAFIPLWSGWPTPEARFRAALTVSPVSEPGERYRYSDLGMITLGVLAERVSGQGLEALVREGVTEPLGMADTGYNPGPEQLDRVAATEYQAAPARGMVRGEVHDENAWSLGGVAGHAGVFSTADDMAVLAQALLNGGSHGGARILSRDGVEAMITDENTGFPGNAHGLGFELDQRWYMAGLAGPRTAGHTGYTGPSLVLDFDSGSFALLLANRVHPSRSWGTNNPARRAVAHGLAEALKVPPRRGEQAWQALSEKNRSATLQVGLDVPATGARLIFDLFLDTDPTDVLALESSTDGGGTWAAVAFDVRGDGEGFRSDGTVSAGGHRTWWRADAQVPGPGTPDGEVLVRWRYTTDASYAGRGVLIDGVRVVARGAGVVLDGEREPDRFDADGWRQVSR